MMDKDEIEILDLDDNAKVSVVNEVTPSNIDNKEIKPNKEVAGDKMGSKKVKKRRLKKGNSGRSIIWKAIWTILGDMPIHSILRV